MLASIRTKKNLILITWCFFSNDYEKDNLKGNLILPTFLTQEQEKKQEEFNTQYRKVLKNNLTPEEIDKNIKINEELLKKQTENEILYQYYRSDKNLYDLKKKNSISLGQKVIAGLLVDNKREHLTIPTPEQTPGKIMSIIKKIREWINKNIFDSKVAVWISETAEKSPSQLKFFCSTIRGATKDCFSDYLWFTRCGGNQDSDVNIGIADQAFKFLYNVSVWMSWCLLGSMILSLIYLVIHRIINSSKISKSFSLMIDYRDMVFNFLFYIMSTLDDFYELMSTPIGDEEKISPFNVFHGMEKISAVDSLNKVCCFVLCTLLNFVRMIPVIGYLVSLLVSLISYCSDIIFYPIIWVIGHSANREIFLSITVEKTAIGEDKQINLEKIKELEGENIYLFVANFKKESIDKGFFIPSSDFIKNENQNEIGLCNTTEKDFPGILIGQKEKGKKNIKFFSSIYNYKNENDEKIERKNDFSLKNEEKFLAYEFKNDEKKRIVILPISLRKRIIESFMKKSKKNLEVLSSFPYKNDIKEGIFQIKHHLFKEKDIIRNIQTAIACNSEDPVPMNLFADIKSVIKKSAKYYIILGVASVAIKTIISYLFSAKKEFLLESLNTEVDLGLNNILKKNIEIILEKKRCIKTGSLTCENACLEIQKILNVDYQVMINNLNQCSKSICGKTAAELLRNNEKFLSNIESKIMDSIVQHYLTILSDLPLPLKMELYQALYNTSINSGNLIINSLGKLI